MDFVEVDEFLILPFHHTTRVCRRSSAIDPTDSTTPVLCVIQTAGLRDVDVIQRPGARRAARDDVHDDDEARDDDNRGIDGDEVDEQDDSRRASSCGDDDRSDDANDRSARPLATTRARRVTER